MKQHQRLTWAGVVGLALLCGAPILSWSWSAETVDGLAPGSDVGRYSSLKVDTLGQPHIAYYDAVNKNLKYAIKLPTGWVAGTVDSTGDVGKWVSLVLDSNNLPHISYYDATNGRIKYARKIVISTGGSFIWGKQTVDTVTLGGGWTSIAYFGDDPHISYRDSGVGLKYARKTSAGWTIETVDTPGWGPYASLAIDSIGTPHIAYADDAISSPGTLRYATKVSGAWSPPQTIATSRSPIRHTSLALASDNRPHIAFYDEAESLNNFIRYVRWDGSTWKEYSAFIDQDPDIQGLSLTIDSNKKPRIAYYGLPSVCTDYCLQYLRLSGTAWVTENPDPWGVFLGIPHGISPSIVLDSGGKPHISYGVPGATLRYTKGS